MTTSLAKTQGAELAQFEPRPTTALQFTPEQSQMIRDMYANGASETEFQFLMTIATARNLNPLLRQVHFVKRKDRQKGRDVWSAQVSIDGLRCVANRTGAYDGQDEPEHEYDDRGLLTVSRVKVYRKGISRPFVGVARWAEYVQEYENKPTKFWNDMAHTMLDKCAEALAIRKAFPEDTGGLYTPEEMGQAENGTERRELGSGGVEDGAPDPVDSSVFDEISGRLKLLEAAWPVCDSYGKTLTLREQLGKHGKPSKLTADIQVAMNAKTITNAQHRELGKRWKKVDYELCKLEKAIPAPGVEASFEDNPEGELVDDADNFDRSA